MNNFIPRDSKYRKMFRVSLDVNKIEKRTNFLAFGDFGIFSKVSGTLTSKQIETIRRVLSKRLKKKGKDWIRVYPNVSMTKKSVGVRMGKGKGNIAFWLFPVKINRVLFEFSGVSYTEAKKIYKLCSSKFSMETALVSKKFNL